MDDRDTADEEGAPHSLPDDTPVCLVAVRPGTFAACRDGYYPCPRSYPRADADADVLAFYRTAPVSAVTHYARIERRVVERRGNGADTDVSGADSDATDLPDGGGDDRWLTEERWARLLDPVCDTDEAMVFELGRLCELATPVRGDGRGVRGAWYPTLGALDAADSLDALRERL